MCRKLPALTTSYRLSNLHQRNVLHQYLLCDGVYLVLDLDTPFFFIFLNFRVTFYKPGRALWIQSPAPASRKRKLVSNLLF